MTGKRSADEAYKLRVQQIHSHWKRIQEGLTIHATEAGKRIHWGHVGDLGYVAEKLDEIARFINNEEA